MRKIALWTTYIYFFICPIEFVLNSYLGSSVKYVAIVAAAFILMFFIGTPKQKIRIGSIQACIVLWAAFEAASYMWTLETRSTMKILITYLMMAVLVLAISIFPFTKKEFENILLFYTAGAMVLSLLVLFFGENYLGFSISGRITLRIHGQYLDPNGLAADLLAPVFYALYRCLKKDKPVWNILFAVLFLTMSSTVFATGSRGALLSYMLGILVFILVRSSKKNRHIILISIPFIFVISFLVLRSVLDAHTFNRLFNFNDYEDGSGRIKMWITALSQIVRYPLFGRGVTSYMGYFLETFNITYAMHNTYLAMLLDVGLVGFCLFMFPAAKSFVSAAKNKNTMICAALASCLLSAFFIDALLSRYIWNVMIIGILYYNTHCQQKEEA